MGKTVGIITLCMGVINLVLSIVWTPGALLPAAVFFFMAYLHLKGTEGKRVHVPPPPMYTADEETVVCANCGTENLAVAKACRGCAKPLPQSLLTTDTTKTS